MSPPFHYVFIIQFSVKLFYEVPQRRSKSAVVTLVKHSPFFLIEISPRFVFLFLGISADWASTVVDVLTFFGEPIQTARQTINVVNIYSYAHTIHVASSMPTLFHC